ncbi:unnamed protein product [Spirodela intermedia]|uniref:Uncharacterized protein n=1 Tax=Spirodela intermedia TaxID=51605 RepID=A0ABN7ECD5_SPIIN|nr:unnamed protein product [Spirodela intermedia]
MGRVSSDGLPVAFFSVGDGGEDATRRRTVSSEYRKKLLQYKELESRVRTGKTYCFKEGIAKTEDDLKSLQSVGQIIGEVLRPLDHERCKNIARVPFIVILSIYKGYMRSMLEILSVGLVMTHFCPSV